MSYRASQFLQHSPTELFVISTTNEIFSNEVIIGELKSNRSTNIPSLSKTGRSPKDWNNTTAKKTKKNNRWQQFLYHKAF